MNLTAPRRLYKIAAYVGATELTLDSEYRGDSGSGISYEIDPPGIPLIRIWPRPASARHVYLVRQRAPKELFDDEEVPEYPDEFADVLICGATYMALKERGDTELAQLEKRDYEALVNVRKAKNSIVAADIVRQVRTWGTILNRSNLPGNYPVVWRVR